jgi:single-strand DNA-binding protein
VSRSLNKAILIGNAGADPEIRTTTNGNRVAQFNLATGYRKRDGTDVTHWHRIVAWERANAGGGDPFSVIDRFVKKGEKLYVEGEIQYRSYEDKEGVTRYVTEIAPREVILLGSGGGGGEGSPSRDRAPARTAARGDYEDFEAPSLEEDDDLPF